MNPRKLLIDLSCRLLREAGKTDPSALDVAAVCEEAAAGWPLVKPYHDRMTEKAFVRLKNEIISQLKKELASLPLPSHHSVSSFW